jgi:hypothetical protein
VPRDQTAVPAQQRGRRDQKRLPACSWQQPARGGKEDPIFRRQLRATCLSAKHRQLVPKHNDLQLLELG